LKIQPKGFVLIIILLGAAGIVPALAWHPVFAAGNTTSSTNSTSTLTTSTNATATKTNSTSTPPPTPTSSSGNSQIPTPSGSARLIVITDKPSYNYGDKVTISGRSDAYLSDTPVTIKVRSPIGNIVKFDQVILGTDQTFSTTLMASGPLWQAAGNYTVYAQLGTPDRSATTTFAFTGGKSATTGPSTIPVDGTNFSIQYTITNGKVLDIKADQPHTSLIVSIQTTGDGVLTITLPRALIDSKNSDGTDKPYAVANDGKLAQFNETSTTSTDRTLVIPFKNGTQQIAIMGTFVVPEFGPIAALVLAIAIITIIAVSKKTQLQFMPKY
jgi:predicted secreted protein with PEFG-CTERM motif